MLVEGRWKHHQLHLYIQVSFDFSPVRHWVVKDVETFMTFLSKDDPMWLGNTSMLNTWKATATISTCPKPPPPGGQTWHAQGFAMVFFAKTLGSYDVTWTYSAPGFPSSPNKLATKNGHGYWSWVGCFRRSKWNAQKSPQNAIWGIVWRLYTSTWEFALNMNLWMDRVHDWKWSMICKIYWYASITIRYSKSQFPFVIAKNGCSSICSI